MSDAGPPTWSDWHVSVGCPARPDPAARPGRAWRTVAQAVIKFEIRNTEIRSLPVSRSLTTLL